MQVLQVICLLKSETLKPFETLKFCKTGTKSSLNCDYIIILSSFFRENNEYINFGDEMK